MPRHTRPHMASHILLFIVCMYMVLGNTLTQATSPSITKYEDVDSDDDEDTSSTGGRRSSKYIPRHPWRDASMATFLNATRDRWVDGLLSEESHNLLVKSMSKLPGRLTEGIIFEARLDDDPQVDFSTSSLFDDRHRNQNSMLTALAQPTLEPALQDLVSQSPVWQRLREFALYWHKEKPKAWADFWLEFDVTPESVDVPAPSIFLSPGDMSNELSREQWKTHVDSHFMAEFQTAFKILTGSEMPEGHRSHIQNAIYQVPRGGELHQVGFWLTRQAEFVRLIVINSETECKSTARQISQYLHRIAYPGNRTEVRQVVAQACQYVDRVVLAVDVGEKTYEKLGFESYVEEAGETSDGQPVWIWKRYLNFLDWIAQQGKGKAEKVEHIRFWTGYTRKPEFRDKGSSVSKIEGVPGIFKFVRMINHIKLIYQPGQPLSGKMYLWTTRGDWGDKYVDWLKDLARKRLKASTSTKGEDGEDTENSLTFDVDHDSASTFDDEDTEDEDVYADPADAPKQDL